MSTDTKVDLPPIDIQAHVNIALDTIIHTEHWKDIVINKEYTQDGTMKFLSMRVNEVLVEHSERIQVCAVLLLSAERCDVILANIMKEYKKLIPKLRIAIMAIRTWRDSPEHDVLKQCSIIILESMISVVTSNAERFIRELLELLH